MQEQLISFKTAKLAKEKGFKKVCYDAYDRFGNLYSNGWLSYLDDLDNELEISYDDLKFEDCLAPTQSSLRDWLREKFDMEIVIKPLSNQQAGKVYSVLVGKYSLSDTSLGYVFIPSLQSFYKLRFKKALNKGLQRALTLI